jgi:hypothetical protein
MKITNLVVVAAVAIGSLGIAIAQPAPGPGPGGPGGGRGAALRAACGADIEANCAGKQGPEIRQCLTDNKAKISAGCQTALSAPPPGGGATP